MNDPTLDGSTPARSISFVDRAVAVLPFAGLATVLLLALVWHDVLPGGWRLRFCFGPDARRQGLRDAAHLAERLEQFERENPTIAPGSILFLGSSTIERFPLEEAFPGKPCLNRGIANLPAGVLAANLAACIPPAPPAGVVLYAGSVDWRASGRDDAVLLDRVAAVVDATARELPGVPLLLLGLLPERGTPPDAVAALRRANERLAALASERSMAFLDPARPPIADPSGALSEDASTDLFHLNTEGYRHLAGWIAEEGGRVGALLAP
ncbi:MAG: GDSL-type esterase/lipase family protein [Planctomycetota bacterium]